MRKLPLFTGSVILYTGWVMSFIMTGDPVPAMSLASGAVVLLCICLSIE